MASYSFKSVGRTQTTINTETPTEALLPIGIKTPIKFGKSDLFEMHYSLANQMADNLRNLILTNWGERLGLFNYGANLRPLLANYSSPEDFDVEAMRRISDAVQRWMPYIELEDFSTTTDTTDTRVLAIVVIRITYGIPALNVKRRGLELTLYAM